MNKNLNLPIGLGVFVLLVLAWSGIHPHDRFTWVMEVFPVLVTLPLLAFTHKKFPLTPILYILIAFHCCVLMMGGKYTYALTPLGDWARETFGLARNPYDRFGHVVQGFVPAIAIRELLLRTSPLKAGKWVFALILFACLGISAVYEIIEWATAMLTGEAADSFLGTQGDIWDTQKDMVFAGLGALLALITLSRYHDRQLDKVK